MALRNNPMHIHMYLQSFAVQAPYRCGIQTQYGQGTSSGLYHNNDAIMNIRTIAKDQWLFQLEFLYLTFKNDKWRGTWEIFKNNK